MDRQEILYQLGLILDEIVAGRTAAESARKAVRGISRLMEILEEEERNK